MMPAADQEQLLASTAGRLDARRDDPDTRTGRRRGLALSRRARRQHREGACSPATGGRRFISGRRQSGRPASRVSASASTCVAPAREHPSPTCCSCSPGGRASLGEAADLHDLQSRAPIGVELAAEPERARDPPVTGGGSNDRLELRRASGSAGSQQKRMSDHSTSVPPSPLRQRHGEPELVRAEEIANRRERSRALATGAVSGPTGHENTSLRAAVAPAFQTRTRFAVRSNTCQVVRLAHLASIARARTTSPDRSLAVR